MHTNHSCDTEVECVVHWKLSHHLTLQRRVISRVKLTRLTTVLCEMQCKWYQSNNKVLMCSRPEVACDVIFSLNVETRKLHHRKIEKRGL